MFSRELPIRNTVLREEVHPFKIFLIKDNNAWKFGVYHDSLLLKSMSISDSQTILEKLKTNTPVLSDDGWQSFELTSLGNSASSSTKYYVWLEIEFDVPKWPKITKAVINSGKTTDGWWGGGELEHDGGVSNIYTQSKARIVLGEIRINSENIPYVVQFVKNHLRLEQNLGSAKSSNVRETATKTIGIKYGYPIG